MLLLFFLILYGLVEVRITQRPTTEDKIIKPISLNEKLRTNCEDTPNANSRANRDEKKAVCTVYNDFNF